MLRKMTLTHVTKNAAQAAEAAAHLAAGRAVALATDTVYGIATAPTAAGLAALGALKGRPPGKPSALSVASPAVAARIFGAQEGSPLHRAVHALLPGEWRPIAVP